MEVWIVTESGVPTGVRTSHEAAERFVEDRTFTLKLNDEELPEFKIYNVHSILTEEIKL
jgi:hypothetical protein